jgi:hypothetical protein
MRDILIKTSTSPSKQRRHLFMSEIINDGGMVARAEKHYVYFVSEWKKPMKKGELQAWMASQSKMRQKKPRHIFIHRVYDRDTGIGQTLYRTTGSFFVVRNFRIYAVVFLHSVKFDILSSSNQPLKKPL